MTLEGKADSSNEMSEAELKGAMVLEEVLFGMTQAQRDMILQYLLDNAGKYPMRRHRQG